ncbi:MAG: dihydroorotase family protein [Candidatus Diapherotrites archaeon]
MDLILENCRAFYRGKLQRMWIGIDGGKITAASEGKIKTPAARTVNCAGMAVIPAAIDAHVHFRTPGFEYKEDWKTGSAAAAAGGVAKVFDMPNTKPATTTQQALDEKMKIASAGSWIGFGMHFGATERNIAELKKVQGVNSFKVYLGSQYGDLFVGDGKKLKEIFEIAKARGFVVCVHAEDRGEEKGVIERALEVRREVGNKLHVCHVSTKDGTRAIVREKKSAKGLLTCEVCPHHLLLTEDDSERLGNFSSVSPPLRTRADAKALWEALAEGTIDCLSSDHAPHTRGDKAKGANGMPGVQTMLPLMIDAVNQKKITMRKLVEVSSRNPARIFGLRGKGEIRTGFDADLAVVDMGREHEIRNSEQMSKCGWTPFDGKRIKGVVVKTIVKGEVVYG